jgi:hypothetical protein
MVSALLVLLCATMCVAQTITTIKLKEATIAGLRVTVGQEAYILQDKVRADRFFELPDNRNFSMGFYRDKGVTYIITFGPPRGGTGPHVITAIETVK